MIVRTNKRTIKSGDLNMHMPITFRAKKRKQGNSYAVTIPKAIAILMDNSRYIFQIIEKEGEIIGRDNIKTR